MRNSPRLRLQDDSHQNVKSVGEIAEYLLKTEFDPETQYYRFDIDPVAHPVRLDDVKSLLSLPFEISMTEEHGKIVFETGTRGQAKGGGDDYLRRRNSSRLHLHTHPIRAELGASQMTVPSLSDIVVASHGDPETPLILVHADGITVFRDPTQVRIGDEVITNADSRELFAIFLDSEGVDVVSEFAGLPRERKMQLEKKFAERSDLIIAQVKWTESEKMLSLLATLNRLPPASEYVSLGNENGENGVRPPTNANIVF